MTTEQISKLPKWAQDGIKTLQRQRDDAVAALNEAMNGDPESPVWYELHPLTGEKAGPVFKKFHVPEHTVNFRLFGKGGSSYDRGVVSVSLRSHDHEPNVQVTFDSEYMAMVPRAGNAFQIVERMSEQRRAWEAWQRTEVSHV